MKKKHAAILSAIHEHLHASWPERQLEFFKWDLGAIKKNVPYFRVARIRPREPNEPKKSWVYVSLGMSLAASSPHEPIELFLLSPFEEALHVELLAMVANYCFESKTSLFLNRVFNIGRPWLEGSTCSHLLISLPYTLGPKVEWMMMPPGQHSVRFLWALPITANEAAYAKAQGVEALEQLFDSHRINPVDPNRASVV